MENWQNLYLELAEKLSTDLDDNELEFYNKLNTIAEHDGKSPIRWLDLWHNQVNFLEDELQFPTPAVFLSFRSKNVQDLGDKLQEMVLQIDCYLFYETFSNSFQGSFNQEDALNFIGLLDFINARLHATTGENYSAMRKVGFAPEDTGNAGNLYLGTFVFIKSRIVRSVDEEENQYGL
jgi:hypothetical protein